MQGMQVVLELFIHFAKGGLTWNIEERKERLMRQTWLRIWLFNRLGCY